MKRKGGVIRSIALNRRIDLVEGGGRNFSKEEISSSILFYDIKFARNQESEQKQSVFPGERSDFAPN